MNTVTQGRVKARGAESRLVSVLNELHDGPYQPGTQGWDHPTRRQNIKLLIDTGLTRKNLPLAAVALDLLAQRQPDTVRGVMYAVVSAGWLPDTSDKSYGRIQRLLNDLRKKGVIGHRWIVDNVRSTIKPSSWSGLDDFADTVAEAYRKDFWSSLENYVCIIVEKDTVAGRIAPVTREYDVALHPLRGFSSTSFTFAIAEEWKRIEKPIFVYYIGDHDPSGRDIERSIKTQLVELSGKNISWLRLAVEPRDFDTYHIIPLKPKKLDTRYHQFVDEFGPDCAEVEAVPADVLRDLVRRAIEGHIEPQQWAKLKDIEHAERESWRKAIDKIAGGAT